MFNVFQGIIKEIYTTFCKININLFVLSFNQRKRLCIKGT